MPDMYYMAKILEAIDMKILVPGVIGCILTYIVYGGRSVYYVRGSNARTFIELRHSDSYSKDDFNVYNLRKKLNDFLPCLSSTSVMVSE